MFCCLPLTIVGIVGASKVESRHYAGDYREAGRLSASNPTRQAVSFAIVPVVSLRTIGADFPYTNIRFSSRFSSMLGAPVRYSSTFTAASRPSAIAQTTRLCPRRISPAAKTPSTLVA